MPNKTIPDLDDATAITSNFSFPASDGLGADKEVDADLFKEFIGTATKSFFVPGTAIRPSASGGAGAVTVTATSSNHPDVAGPPFDASSIEYAQFAVAMPKNWNEGTITAKFYWTHPSTSTNFGVRWGIQAVAISDDDTIDAAYGTAQEVTDTGGTTYDLYITAATSAITIAGTPQAEDMVHFRIYRDPTHAADTMAVDAIPVGVKVYYSTNTTDEV